MTWLRCIYCGYRTRSSGRVCSRCSDLPRHDPYFAASRQMGATAKKATKKAKPAASVRAPVMTRYDRELADTIEGERLRRCGARAKVVA